ncbi:MAG: hypothetical protein F4X37_02695 [Acidimicrobiia bacterium]|nr:hypothetical protein [Acidimicrobiia bacterium]
MSPLPETEKRSCVLPLRQRLSSHTEKSRDLSGVEPITDYLRPACRRQHLLGCATAKACCLVGFELAQPSRVGSQCFDEAVGGGSSSRQPDVAVTVLTKLAHRFATRQPTRSYTPCSLTIRDMCSAERANGR